MSEEEGEQVDEAVRAGRTEFGISYQGIIGQHGSGDGEFYYPAGIALDEQKNRLYVADTFNNRIQVFRASDGAFCFKFGGCGAAKGRLNHPHALAIDKSKGWLWVSDRCNHRIQVFSTADGACLHCWGGLGAEPGRFHCPSALALDCGRDLLFVVDEGNRRVQVLRASEGAWLFELAVDLSLERPVPFFREPVAVAVDCASDRLYVSEKNGGLCAFEASTGLFLDRQPFGPIKAMHFREPSVGSLLVTTEETYYLNRRPVPCHAKISFFWHFRLFETLYQFAIHPFTHLLYIADCANNRIVILRGLSPFV